MGSSPAQVAAKQKLKKEMYIMDAKDHFRDQKYDEAIEDYMHILTIYPNDQNAIYNIGVIYKKQRKFKEALEFLHKSLELNPSDSDAEKQIGNILRYATQREEALVSYSKSIQLHPKNPVVLNSRGCIYFELGRYEEAMQDFNKAIEYKDNFADAYNNKGTVFSKQGKHEDALDQYEKALTLMPDKGEYLNNKANALSNLKKFDEAILAYNQAIKAMPKEEFNYLNKGSTLLQQKKYDEGIGLMDKIISEINPESTIVLKEKAKVLMSLKKPEEAQEYFKKAKEVELKQSAIIMEQQQQISQLYLSNDKLIQVQNEQRNNEINNSLEVQQQTNKLEFAHNFQQLNSNLIQPQFIQSEIILQEQKQSELISTNQIDRQENIQNTNLIEGNSLQRSLIQLENHGTNQKESIQLQKEEENQNIILKSSIVSQKKVPKQEVMAIIEQPRNRSQKQEVSGLNIIQNNSNIQQQTQTKKSGFSSLQSSNKQEMPKPFYNNQNNINPFQEMQEDEQFQDAIENSKNESVDQPPSEYFSANQLEFSINPSNFEKEPLEKSIYEWKDQAKFFFDLGVQQQEVKKWDEAQIQFEKCILIQNNKGIAFLKRGIVLFEKQWYEQSNQDFNQALKLNFKQIQYLQNKNIEEDIQKLKNEQALCHIYQGQIYFNLNRFNEAINAYQKYLELDQQNELGRNQEIYYRQGVLYFQIKEYDKACNYFQNCIACNSQHSEQYDRHLIELNNLLEGESDDQNRIAQFSLEERCTMKQALQLKSDCEVALNNYKQSLTTLEILIQMDSKNLNAQYNKCLILEKLQYNQDSLTEYDRLLKVLPHNYIIYQNKALILLSQQDIQEAQISLKKAFNLNSQNVRGQCIQAKLYLHQNFYKKLREQFDLLDNLMKNEIDEPLKQEIKLNIEIQKKIEEQINDHQEINPLMPTYICNHFQELTDFLLDLIMLRRQIDKKNMNILHEKQKVCLYQLFKYEETQQLKSSLFELDFIKLWLEREEDKECYYYVQIFGILFMKLFYQSAKIKSKLISFKQDIINFQILNSCQLLDKIIAILIESIRNDCQTLKLENQQSLLTILEEIFNDELYCSVLFLQNEIFTTAIKVCNTSNYKKKKSNRVEKMNTMINVGINKIRNILIEEIPTIQDSKLKKIYQTQMVYIAFEDIVEASLKALENKQKLVKNGKRLNEQFLQAYTDNFQKCLIF